jgi:acyl dehydratase
MRLYLEDLTPGMVFSSATQALDAAAIQRFAGEFDPQPFHLDEAPDAAADQNFFGGLAASGWHTAAVTMKLLVGSLPLAGGIVGLGGEISWLKPVRPGDVLWVVTEIVEVTPSRAQPDRGLGVLRSETRNQRDEVVQVFTAKVLLRRRTV